MPLAVKMSSFFRPVTRTEPARRSRRPRISRTTNRPSLPGPPVTRIGDVMAPPCLRVVVAIRERQREAARNHGGWVLHAYRGNGGCGLGRRAGRCAAPVPGARAILQRGELALVRLARYCRFPCGEGCAVMRSVPFLRAPSASESAEAVVGDPVARMPGHRAPAPVTRLGKRHTAAFGISDDAQGRVDGLTVGRLAFAAASLAG